MSGAVAAAAAVVAWAGASTVVLSEGRRGIAAGTVLYALALAVTLAGQRATAAEIAAAGVVAAALRLRDGREGWVVVPPGSTPRLILCIVVGVVGAFIATNLLLGPGPAPARTAVVLGGVMAAARLLSTAHRVAALAAASVLSLALAGAEALAGGTGSAAVTAFGCAGAVLLGLMPAGDEPASDDAAGEGARG